MTTETLKEQSKELARKLMLKISMYGFWALLVFACGVWAGMHHVNHLNEKVTRNSILLGGFVFEGKPFEITERQMPSPIIPVPHQK